MAVCAPLPEQPNDIDRVFEQFLPNIDGRPLVTQDMLVQVLTSAEPPQNAYPNSNIHVYSSRKNRTRTTAGVFMLLHSCPRPGLQPYLATCLTEPRRSLLSRAASANLAASAYRTVA
jgi:hypothetical protein